MKAKSRGMIADAITAMAEKCAILLRGSNGNSAIMPFSLILSIVLERTSVRYTEPKSITIHIEENRAARRER